jgi:tetratricopeptide (TPR) repeat protein
MIRIEEALRTALAHQQAGRLHEAEQVCRQVLQAEPQNVAALHLLGLAALASGDYDAAIRWISDAIRAGPGHPTLHMSLGEAYRAAGRVDEARRSYASASSLDPRLALPHFYLGLLEESQGHLPNAEACYRRAVSLDPAYADAHYALGNLAREAGNTAMALEHYERAIANKPDFFDALISLGSLSRECGHVDQARASLQRAIQLRPSAPEAHLLLGNLESACGNFPGAIGCYENALRLNPNLAVATARLGMALLMLNRRDEAIAHFRRAIELQPGLAEAHYNLGTALAEQGDRPAAVEHFEQTLLHDPRFAAAHVNLGAIFQDQDDDDRALAHLDRACQLNPDAAELQFNRGLICLKQGNLAEGWARYHARLRLPNFPVRVMSEPLWDGSPIRDKALLIHAEQGLGDTFQFVRYVRMAAERCERVLLQVQPPLVPLLRMAGLGPLYGDDDALPSFDFQAPLLSLPGLLGTTLSTIPDEVPYLSVPAELVDRWRDRLKTLSGLRVGIVWRGSPTHALDASRSIPLADFEALARVPGVSLISLQKGAGVELRDVRFDVRALDEPWDEASGPFVDTAAVLKNLDLLVAADTAAAHLAGALGAKVWLALAARADWRWMRGRNDSPWYPTMRLFRQTTAGDWHGVFERIARELTRETAAK